MRSFILKQMFSVAIAIAMVLMASVATEAFASTTCVVLSKNIAPYLKAFEGLKDSVGGKIERFDLDGKRENGAAVVGELQKKNCSVVVPIGSLALDIVRLQITNVPIVYTMVVAPSVAVRSSSSITGVSIEPSVSNVFAMLKLILPNAARVGVIYNPAHTAQYVERVREVAKGMGIHVEVRVATNMKSMVTAVDELLPRIDVLLMVPDPTTSHRKAFEYMMLEGARRGIPLIGVSTKHVRDGALFSFEVDYRDTGRQTGQLVRRVLTGMIRAGTGSFTPERSSLVLNLKTAKRLGIHVEPSVVEGATKVYR